jgi:hypothetical protein
LKKVRIRVHEILIKDKSFYINKQFITKV